MSTNDDDIEKVENERVNEEIRKEKENEDRARSFTNNNLAKVTPVYTEFEIDDTQNGQIHIQKAEPFVHSTSKFWVVFRLAFKITVLLVLIGLVAFVIAAIIVHPGCEPEPELDWWQKALIHRVDFKKLNSIDTDKTESTFKVVEKNVDYFKDWSVDAVWLSQIVDLNKDFVSIDATYGTYEEFKSLVEKFHENEIKVILDFIPNHTTDKCKWFIDSKTNPLYRDYYVWSLNDTLPNNWKSVRDVSAWKLDAGVNKYYLHQFEENEPDLNYRNPKVVDELMNALQFWIDTGIDGFNLINVAHLYEDYLLRDETKIDQSSPPIYTNLRHEFTQHQRETLNIIADIKQFINEKKESTRVLLVELNDLNENTNRSVIKKYFGSDQVGGADLLLFERLLSKGGISGTNFMTQVQKLQNIFDEYKRTPFWVLEHIDVLNPKDYIGNLQAGISLLPGTAAIEIEDQTYKRFFNSSAEFDYDEVDLYKNINEIRHKTANQIGYKTYQNYSKSCEFVQYLRYFDGVNTYAIGFDIEAESSCNDVTFESSIMKGLKADIAYKYLDAAEKTSKLDKLSSSSSVTFNSNGVSKLELPRKTALVLTWRYEPKDLKDFL